MDSELINAVCRPVAAGASGVSGVATRAVAAHDRGEAAGGRPERSVQRGGGAEGAEEPVRASQGARRKGKRHDCYARPCTGPKDGMSLLKRDYFTQDT